MNTPRFGLPNILVAQAHKEITHNESLSRIDALLHMAVVGAATTPPDLSISDAGKCWLVAAPAIGVWQGQEKSVACWNGGSWDMIAPTSGMTIWHEQQQIALRFRAGAWRQATPVNSPQGGTVVDTEARETIAALLAQLQEVGIFGQ